LFYAPKGLEQALGFPPRQAVIVSSYIHTPPSGFGKIMAEVKPRGPLVIADDPMAWHVTKDAIVQREVISSERVQAQRTPCKLCRL
jgi:hypothetical protein